jgi:anti-sigma-K factor RskA
MIDEESERHQMEALLPWYAAGTLSRREADLVERAITGDSELARLYELVRQELVETTHLNETLGAPSGRALEKLFAAIPNEAADAALVSRPRRSRAGSFMPIPAARRYDVRRVLNFTVLMPHRNPA